LSVAREWHRLSAEEVLGLLQVSASTGLADGEVRRRRRQHGANALREPPPPSVLALFLRQFQDFMVLVLLGATAVSFAMGERGDAITIVAIVVVNAILGFVQEYRAERSMAALRQLTAPTARVRRGGEEMRVPAQDLVPGDILLLEAGDRVPADARLVEASRLAVEEATLTGESQPAAKDAGWLGDGQSLLGDRRNMVYAGTTVVRGRAVAVVVATGMATEMGAIAALIQEQRPEPTPLEQRLEGLGKVLVVACLAITAVVTAAGIARGEPPYTMFLTGVSLAVAAIPEGLPAIVTIALAVGVQRMIRRRALVRRLPAVETLGSATVICSDKTGTLTKNEMTVRRLWVGGRSVEVTGDGYDGRGRVEAEDPRLHALCRELLAAAALCTDTRLRRRGRRVEVQGDPTEAALLVAAAKVGVDVEGLRRRHPRRAEEPFDPATRRMWVEVDAEAGPTRIVKGAPEVVLAEATHVLEVGGVRPLGATERAAVLTACEAMGEAALRTLAVLRREGRGPAVLLGLVGLVDPPRPEAKRAIARCRSAGVRVVMITGDHAATARSVAAALGLLDGGGRVLLGDEVERMSDAELEAATQDLAVCARVSPTAKLRLVRAFRRRGEIVAMTGDGVNDAPAVREADIGVAMGITGTDVTKEASALILADDNFATIAAAIEEGRGIYDNIRKFVRYLLACNVGEVLVMFLAAVVGLPMPLLPIQILWVNLVTDGLPAMALGVDPVDPEVMARPPRPPNESVFARRLGVKIASRGFLIGLSTLGVFALALGLGLGLDKARTMAFATLVLAQLFHVFDCRSETRAVFDIPLGTNPYLLGAVLSSLLLLGAAIYAPGLRPLFETVPLGRWDVAAVLAVAGLPSTLIGLRRLVLLARWRRRHALG
jgi:Ca2+-transporting ATPase